MEFVALLNYQNFFHLFKAQSDEGKIDVCTSVLLQSFRLVEENGVINAYNIDTKKMIWVKQTRILNEYLETVVNTFLALSAQALQRDCPTQKIQNLLFDEPETKLYEKMLAGTIIGKLAMWKTKLICTNLVLDDDVTGIHFANGRFDLLSGVFTERDPFSNNMTTKTIDYDYVPFNSPEELNERCQDFYSFLQKIYVEADVLNYVCSVIGRALLGDTSDRDLLYLYGSGRNGKTLVLELLKKTLGDLYFLQIKSDAFDSTAEANWLMTNITSTHRILFWDEPTHAKKVAGQLKLLCNGKISARKMRSDKSKEIAVRAKLFVGANKIVSFDSGSKDGGINDRFNYYRCKSTFRRPEDITHEDPVNHIYVANLELGDPNKDLPLDMKMTIFHFFAYFAKMKVARPPLIVKGDQIFNIRKVANYCLYKSEGSFVALDDFIAIIGKLHPFHMITKKEILKELQILNIAVDITKVTKAVSQVKVKGAIVGYALTEWGTNACTQEIPATFVFSELPEIADTNSNVEEVTKEFADAEL